MKTGALTGWGMAGALSMALAVGCASQKRETARAVTWNTAYDAALADAGKNGRPILLDFYTDW
jgi:thiol:disulfide interchange protein